MSNLEAGPLDRPRSRSEVVEAPDGSGRPRVDRELVDLPAAARRAFISASTEAAAAENCCDEMDGADVNPT